MAETIGVEGRGQLLRLGRRHPRRRAEPPPAGRRAAGDGAAGRPRTHVPAGREGQGLRGDAADRPASSSSAASTSATATSPASRPTRRSRRTSRRRFEHRLVALGRRAVLRPGRQGARRRRPPRRSSSSSQPPRLLFDEAGGPTPDRNLVRFRLGSSDGVTFTLQAKTPGQHLDSQRRRPRRRLRVRARRAAGGLRAPARRRHRRQPPPLRPRGRRRADVARRAAGARRPGPGVPVRPGLVGTERGRRRWCPDGWFPPSRR